MTLREIEVILDTADPVRPVRLRGIGGTVLAGETLYVRSGTTAAHADEIVYRANRQIPFSVFFPSEDVINNGSPTKPSVPGPLNGGDVFDSADTGADQEVHLKVNAKLAAKRQFEYYVTVQDPPTGHVYTDDPDVYVDC